MLYRRLKYYKMDKLDGSYEPAVYRSLQCGNQRLFWPTNHTITAHNHLKDLKGELQDIRGDIEKYCSDWYGMATTTVGKANIEPSMPCVVGWQQHRSNVEAGTPKDYNKRSLTILLLDHLISEIDTYFDPNNDAVMSSLLCLLTALLVS